MVMIIAQDTFATRSVTGSSSVSFGTGSDGEVWQAPAGGLFHTVFGVGSGEGFMYSDGGGNAGGEAYFGKIAFKDIDLTCRFKFGVVTGNPLFYLLFRTADINNSYDITVNATTGAVVLERWAPSNNTTFSMGTFGALTAGSYYHLRIQADGTAFRAKVWADGSSEPGSFAYTTTDTFAGRQVAGFFGAGVTNVAATTQGNGVQFDNLVASVLYPAQDLYVSSSGNDSTGDGSQGNPWLTIQHGLNAISPSGTLHVEAGTYAQSSGVQLTCTASGNASNHIVVQSDAALGAKITGTNVFTIFQVNGSYVDILAFDLSATDSICQYGLVFADTGSAQGNYVHDIHAVSAGTLGGSAISAQNSSNAYVSGAVDVLGNFITRIGTDGTDANNSGGFIHDIYLSNQGGRVQNNIVVGCAGNAVTLGHGASNHIVTNNTFVGNLAGGIELWAGGAGVGLGSNDHFVVANNLIAHNTGTVHCTSPTQGIQELSPGVGPHGVYANNLLYDNILSTTAPYVGLQYEFLSGGVPINFLFTTPQMVNYQQDGSGDYHLLATSPCLGAALNYDLTALADNPLRYYRLSETGGSTATDEGSGLHNGTIQNPGSGVLLAQPGLIGNDADTAMQFVSSSSGYIALPTTGLPTGASAWSIEAWVLFPVLPAAGTFPTVLAFGTASTNQMAELLFRGSSGVFELDDWTSTVVTSSASVVAGVIYHLVVTYNGTTATIYQNGVSVGSAAKTFNIGTTFAQIGNDTSGTYFNGLLGKVALYPTALTLTQVANHYAAGLGQTSALVPSTDYDSLVRPRGGLYDIGAYEYPYLLYSTYRDIIEPQMVAALAANSLLNNVQVIGPDTAMVNDSWLTSSSADLAGSLAGYVRHAFPTNATDISNDSREVAVKTLVSGIYANDPTAKPIIQGEMGFGYAGPGQSVTLYQYGVDMADYAVQLARAGMAALMAYDLDDDMHGTEWGMWQITTDTGVPRPWFFPWSLLSNTLVIGSTLYAPAQPASNDFRCLAATSPQGFWTIVLINRKSIAQNVQVVVPFAPVVTTSVQVFTYSQATPLLVDTNGFPLASGTLTVVLHRGFTTSIAANSVLILTQNAPSSSAPPPVGPGLPPPPPIGPTTINTIDVKRPPLEKRR